jgi:hypothetical protein
MMRLAVVGNPGNRRVALFAAAVGRAGLPAPAVYPWHSVLSGGPVPAEALDFNVEGAPGVTAELGEILRGAGLGTADEVVEQGLDALLAIEDMNEDVAEAILAWSQEQLEKSRESVSQDIGQTFRRPEVASSSMGDEDFMAALSRAFQESETQRQTSSALDFMDEAAAEEEDAEDAEDGEQPEGEPNAEEDKEQP